jgi:hypothetical protein
MKGKKKISFHGSSHAGNIGREIFLVIVSIISRLLFFCVVQKNN